MSLGLGENLEGNQSGEFCLTSFIDRLETHPFKLSLPIRYAPFASLTPRVSFFDSILPGPAPGTYDSLTLPLKKGDKAPYFGRSKAIRFDAKPADTPGPGSYVLPSSLQLKASLADKSKISGLISTSQDHPLTREPVLESVSASNLSSYSQGLSSSAPDLQRAPIAVPGLSNGSGSTYPPVESVSLHPQTDPKLLGPTAERLLFANRRMPGISSAPTAPQGSRSKSKITWKRKHLPPSIPRGNFSFGYSETSGEYL
jgi:hypothetical protein